MHSRRVSQSPLGGPHSIDSGMAAWHGQDGDRQPRSSAPSPRDAKRPGTYRRGVCHLFNDRGHCGRGEQCLYHHVRSQRVHARYDMGEHAASDISIDLKGTPAVVISAGGTVRLRGGIPREWEYFRALNVVLRAVDLRAMYDTDLTGEWRVTRRSDRSGSEAAVLSPHADTSIPAFTAEAFEHVRAVVRRLPGEIEVARVPPVQNAGGR